MIPRTALTQIGKALAQDLEAGHIDDALAGFGEALAADSAAMKALFDLVAREDAKKKPNGGLIAAYALMLERGLDVLSLGAEHGDAEATALAGALKAHAQTLAQAGKFSAATLATLLRAFVAVRLDPGEELRAILGDSIEQSPDTMAEADLQAFPDMLMDHFEGDVFAFHGELATQVAILPTNQRGALAAALLNAPTPEPREAAIGCLLDKDGSVRCATAALLEQAAAQSQISGTMLRRMIALRNWLPEAERPGVDAAVKASRLKGIDCSSLPRATIEQVGASGFDGAGAQSLFAVVKEGRKYAVASLLIRLDAGVRDAWVSHAMTKKQALGMLDQVAAQIGLYGASPDYMAETLGHALGLNAQAGTLPPFGLLDLLETMGWATINPEPLSDDALLARLIEEIPPRQRGAASVKRALKASAQWPENHDFLASWFEDGPELSALLKRGKPTPPQCQALILDQYLPSRRAHWAKALLWVARLLRASPEHGEEWVDFTLVAREVAGNRPLADIPAMVLIAAITTEAWFARG